MTKDLVDPPPGPGKLLVAVGSRDESRATLGTTLPAAGSPSATGDPSGSDALTFRAACA